MMTNPTDSNSKINAYRRVNVETRSEPQLLVDLCDRAVVAIATAAESHDDSERREALQRARDIVAFLQESLSLEAGGAVAVNLFRHYTFLIRKLMEAQNDPEADLALLQTKMQELHVTWREAVQIVEEQQASSDE